MPTKIDNGWRTMAGTYEIGRSDGGVVVRDSRDPAAPVLWLTRDQLAEFLGRVHDGRFDDLSRHGGAE